MKTRLLLLAAVAGLASGQVAPPTATPVHLHRASPPAVVAEPPAVTLTTSPAPLVRPQAVAPAKAIMGGALLSRRAVRPGERSVVLTFDDGPDPRWTPQVLVALDRAHVKAVFCLIGERVKEHPELVRAIAQRGHELCNHTLTHDLGLKHRSNQRIDYEIAMTTNLITAAAGRPPIWFRAPGGRFTPIVDLIAQRRGLRPLSWSADPQDWRRPGAGAIVRRVLRDVRPGYVVLMHDGGGDRAQSTAALRALLAQMPRHGYRFVLP